MFSLLNGHNVEVSKNWSGPSQSYFLNGIIPKVFQRMVTGTNLPMSSLEAHTVRTETTFLEDID